MTDQNCEHEEANGTCSGRRQFIYKAVAATAGAALFTAIGAHADADDGELELKLAKHDALKKIGGYETLDTKVGKVVVARVDENTFVACSAVCPHKGGPIDYDPDKKDFFCPWHRSRFDTSGKVTHGPARDGLQSYSTETEAVVKIKA